MTPVQVPGLADVVAVAAGWAHNLAVKRDGTVWAWGVNIDGQLGSGTTGGNDRRPRQVANLTDVVDVAAGTGHSLALKKDGTVWAWGLNIDGQLGVASVNGSPEPMRVSKLEEIKEIAAGDHYSLALKKDGVVYAWGWNGSGTLGDRTQLNRNVPVRTSGLTGILTIAAGRAHSFALREDGTIFTWGNNSDGQLGDGTDRDRYVPVPMFDLNAHDAVLRDLVLRDANGSEIALKPLFSKYNPSFTVGVLREVDRITVEPTADRPDAEIEVRLGGGLPVAVRSGQASPELPLSFGVNEVLIGVRTAEGTAKTYAVAVRRIAGFADIAGHWAERDILRAAIQGMISGYPDGTFGPDRPVTRAEVTVMLINAFGLGEAESDEPLFVDDARIGAWAKGAVLRAVEAGVIVGYEDGSFRPNASVTRSELAVMIARLLGLDTALQVGAQPATGFADDVEIPLWAKRAAEALRREGLLEGRSGGRFEPNDTASRAEAAVLLLRLTARLE